MRFKAPSVSCESSRYDVGSLDAQFRLSILRLGQRWGRVLRAFTQLKMLINTVPPSQLMGCRMSLEPQVAERAQEPWSSPERLDYECIQKLIVDLF